MTLELIGIGFFKIFKYLVGVTDKFGKLFLFFSFIYVFMILLWLIIR